MAAVLPLSKDQFSLGHMDQAKETNNARNGISREQEAFPSATWERGEKNGSGRRLTLQ